MKKSGKLFAILGCSLALVGAAGAGIAATRISANGAAIWTPVEIGENITVNDTFTFPAGQVVIDGKSYTANVSLAFPDGSIVRKTQSSQQVALDMVGIYTLSFEARDDGGVLHKNSQQFTVYEKLWRTESSNSQVGYGSYSFKEATAEGLMVRLAKNDTLHFNQIIDLAEIDASTPLFMGFITPDVKGAADFNRLTFTLTDALDEDCYLKISGKRSGGSDEGAICYSYWTAGGNGQALSGWENNKYHYQTTVFGTPMSHSWGAYAAVYSGGQLAGVTEQKTNSNPFRIYLDRSTMVVSTQNSKIVDLDDPAEHTTEGLWKGFKSNKVRLSVTASDIGGATANFCIQSVPGYDFTGANILKESTPPEIAVDVDNTLIKNVGGKNTFIPEGLVGGSYPVPTASAFDLYSGHLSVQTNVYYNYSYPEARTNVSVRNGRFTTNYPGAYTIVYSATDYMGNSAEVLYWVDVKTTPTTPIGAALPASGYETQAVCGEVVPVADVTYSEDSFVTGVSITAKHGATEIAVENGAFIPTEEGDWTVTYIVTNYANISDTVSYTVAVTRSAAPVFSEEAQLPRYYVSGIQVTVPTLQAGDYSTGTFKNVTADVRVTDSEGTKTYRAGEKFTPKISGINGNITLTFVAGSTEKQYTVPAVNPFEEYMGDLEFYIERMFVGTNFTATRERTGLNVKAVSAGELEWIYANCVAAENSGIRVKGQGAKSNFSAMTLTYIDSVDPSIRVTMRLEADANDGCVRIRFGDTDRVTVKGFSLGNDASGNPLDEFTFNYSNDKFNVDSIAVTVTADDNGRPFNGFPSGRVYLSSKVEGVKANSEYLIQQFDNHGITRLALDKTPPKIGVSGNNGGIYRLNDVYTISPAYASDTVDSEVACTVTVLMPDGSVAKDINGVSLSGVDSGVSYTFRLTSYGQYKVQYSATDCNNQRGTEEYAISVIDVTAPTLQVAKEWSANAKVGDEAALPRVRVTDDNTAADKIVIYRAVRNPNGVLVFIGYDYEVRQDGSREQLQYKYVYRYAGEYTFIVCAVDEAGNQTTVTYKVTVTER